MSARTPALAAALEELADLLAERVAERVCERLAQAEPGQERSPWMGVERAAAHLDLPRQRLYRLSASGAIPHYKQGGRLLFDRAELDDWLRRQAQPSSREKL